MCNAPVGPKARRLTRHVSRMACQIVQSGETPDTRTPFQPTPLPPLPVLLRADRAVRLEPFVTSQPGASHGKVLQVLAQPAQGQFPRQVAVWQAARFAPRQGRHGLL